MSAVQDGATRCHIEQVVIRRVKRSSAIIEIEKGRRILDDSVVCNDAVSSSQIAARNKNTAPCKSIACLITGDGDIRHTQSASALINPATIRKRVVSADCAIGQRHVARIRNPATFAPGIVTEGAADHGQRTKVQNAAAGIYAQITIYRALVERYIAGT